MSKEQGNWRKDSKYFRQTVTVQNDDHLGKKNEQRHKLHTLHINLLKIIHGPCKTIKLCFQNYDSKKKTVDKFLWFLVWWLDFIYNPKHNPWKANIDNVEFIELQFSTVKDSIRRKYLLNTYLKDLYPKYSKNSQNVVIRKTTPWILYIYIYTLYI